MRFVKMHGLGNDYVLIDGFHQTVHDPAALARRISDRHFGVGSDGLILVLPPDPGVDAHVRMRMFNADGSEAEMCGNGIRCVCKLAYDHNLTPSIRQAQPMRIQTGRGVLSLTYSLDAHGKVNQVTVDMGPPVLEPQQIPVNLKVDRIIDYPLAGIFHWPAALQNWEKQAALDGGLTCLSMGNPHAIFFCRNLQAVPLETLGPLIETHPIFPRRTNVHFVTVHSPSELTMRTWERGSGITLACGTGASAVCVAGVLTGRSQRRVLIHLPGGDLQLFWNPQDQHVYLTGPAVEVFQGDWPD